MVYRSSNADEVANLKLSLQAHASVISDYAIRTRQAEEAVRMLTHSSCIPNDFALLVAKHINERTSKLNIELQRMLEAIEVSLSIGMTNVSDETLKTLVNNTHKEVSRFLGTLETTYNKE